MMRIAFALFILVTTGAWASAQNGGRASSAEIPLRVIQADRIVIGKLGAIEEKSITAVLPPWAKVKLEFRMMELKVEEGLRGAKKGDVIRFGFPTPPTVREGRPVRPDDFVAFSERQECLFFLSKHPEEDFWYAPMDYPSVDKKANGYAADLELTRRSVKLWDNPKAGLQAKDADDRLLMAGMLLHHYGHYRPGQFGPETEAIPAEESKLILTILRDADWKAKPSDKLPGCMLPAGLFYRTGVHFKDGWRQEPGTDLETAAKSWIDSHADTFRIQRFTPVATGKKDK